MFKRTHHQAIEMVLHALDGDQLRACRCYFGGGTAIVLRHGEYRESVDLDFMVSDIQSYRSLRQLVGSRDSISPLLRTPAMLVPQGNIRSDQYGIRTWLEVAGTKIKFEIVFEARIDFEMPAARDHVLGITTLSVADLTASKLLANSDRWADDGVFNRDLMDLAMIANTPAEWRRAVAKATTAYGDAVRIDLEKAIERINTRQGWLDHCMQALSIDIPKAMLAKRLKALHRRSGMH